MRTLPEARVFLGNVFLRCIVAGVDIAKLTGAGQAMFSPVVHILLRRMTDPTQHRAENELFQLYHQPELRGLPEVAWVDRWVCAPDCTAHATRTAEGRFDYAVITWLRPPAHASALA